MPDLAIRSKSKALQVGFATAFIQFVGKTAKIEGVFF